MKKISKTTKIIIYSILIIIIFITYFACSNKVKSYRKSLQEQSNNLSQEIYNNFQEKIASSTEEPLSLGLMAEELYNKGFPKLSTIVLDKALENNPPYRDLYLFAAAIYFNEGEFSLAKDTAQKACDLDPIYSPTYELLTQIYTALGDEENSKLCYNKAEEFRR